MAAVPPATAAREAGRAPVEVPAPPPVADANPPTLAPSDDVAGRQMAAALARLADNGDGDPAAEAWAAQTLREAAIEGLAEAQYALAVLYQRGRGVSEDPVRALLWYHSAAEQGHAPAQFNLGVFHLEARGVPRNYAEARRWFTRATDQRLWQAEFNLGVLRERGVFSAPDLTAAEAHYRQAAALGGARARARLAALAAGETAKPAFQYLGSRLGDSRLSVAGQPRANPPAGVAVLPQNRLAPRRGCVGEQGKTSSATAGQAVGKGVGRASRQA